MTRMSWQKHTVRGFIAGALKKLYTVASTKSEAGERTYAIEAKGLKVTRLTMPGSPFSVNHRTLLSRRTPNWAPWPERGTPSKINPGDDL